jgi:hypothetical protein
MENEKRRRKSQTRPASPFRSGSSRRRQALGAAFRFFHLRQAASAFLNFARITQRWHRPTPYCSTGQRVFGRLVVGVSPRGRPVPSPVRQGYPKVATLPKSGHLTLDKVAKNLQPCHTTRLAIWQAGMAQILWRLGSPRVGPFHSMTTQTSNESSFHNHFPCNAL